MGRHTAIVTITEDNRDHGKHFILREMPAAKSEKWAMRALCAMAASGAEIPPEAVLGGMAVVAVVGLRALFAAPYAEVEPLLEEMMGCVSIVVDKAPEGRPLLDDDIEEVGTRIKLRDEVLKLHTGFSLADALSMMASAQSLPSPSSETPELSPSTPTSPTPSEP